MLGQLYQKTTVDADPVSYMYNKKGQVVLEQDGIARAGTDYSATPWLRRSIYDQYGRLIRQEKDVLNDQNPVLNPLSYTTYPSPNIPTPTGPGQNQLQVTYATSLDYAYSLQGSTFVGGIGEVWLQSFGAYQNIRLQPLEIEKEFFYGNALVGNYPSYLDSRTTAFFGKYPQSNMSGRLGYSLAYNGSNKIKFCAYSYTPEGYLAYEAHQFSATDLSPRRTDLILATAYPSYNLRGSVKSMQVWDLGINNVPVLYPVMFSQDYTYDGWNRILQVSANNSLIADYAYDDALGLLKTTNYYAAGLGGCQVTVDNIASSFDIRDRLTSRVGKLFEESLYYDKNSPTILPAVYGVKFDALNGNYNGNINVAQSVYHTNVASNDPGTFTGPTYYGYTYDGMNRLTNADASIFDPLLTCPSISTPTANNPALFYGDEGINYDKVGNILTMTRGTYYQSACSSPNEVKHWAYQYQGNTNILLAINDTKLAVNPQFSYTYDPSGNLRTDGRTQTHSIIYTRDNVIGGLTLNGEKPVSYLYDANDDRIYSSDLDDNETQFYLRDLSGKDIGVNSSNVGWEWNVYGNNHIATIQNSSTQFYEYDHLGGVRTTFAVSALNCPGSGPLPTYSLNYVADYYAFGKILRSFVPNTNLDRYGFDGSERDKRISENNYTTHFRELDSEIGRWWAIDPKLKFGESSFAIFSNNPVLFIDPRGDVSGTGDDKKKKNHGTIMVYASYERTRGTVGFKTKLAFIPLEFTISKRNATSQKGVAYVKIVDGKKVEAGYSLIDTKITGGGIEFKAGPLSGSNIVQSTHTYDNNTADGPTESHTDPETERKAGVSKGSTTLSFKTDGTINVGITAGFHFGFTGAQGEIGIQYTPATLPKLTFQQMFFPQASVQK